MYDEMTLEAGNAATIRLVNSSWANYLTRLLQRLKTIGHFERANGTEALVKRLKRARPETYYHSVRVSRLSRAVGRAFGFDDARHPGHVREDGQGVVRLQGAGGGGGRARRGRTARLCTARG